MKIEARKWDGEEWPEKRVSIADIDTKFCLFVSARYADIDEAKIQADEVCRRVNCHDELVDELEAISRHIINMPPCDSHLYDWVEKTLQPLLAKAKGEQ